MMNTDGSSRPQQPSWALIGLGIAGGILISLCVALYALMLR